MTQDKKNTYRRKTSAMQGIDDAASVIGNVPPQAVDIERAVIGAMMVDSECLTDAMGSLNERCFYDPRTRNVFKAISVLYNSNRPVDLLTVCEQMKADGTLETSGGAPFLAELSSNVGSAIHAQYHVLILQQKAIQRNLIDASFGILRDAFSENTPVDDLVESASRKVYDAIQMNMTSTYKHVGDVANRSMEMISKVQSEGVMPGIPTGFPKLDAITSGWQPSNLIIIGARPSMGKTAFALDLARAAAVRFNVPVGFFTLEMHDTELTDRLLSSMTGVPSYKIKGKGGYKLTGEEWSRLENGLNTLSRAQMFIDETPGLPITEFVTKARKLKHDHDIGLIIIDYLQLMQGSSSSSGYREQEVSSISRTLKATAKDLNIPIIALSQLNRNLAARPGSNGRPMLSDLRESGAIEQDADMVMFVHRPFMLGFGEDEHATEIIVAKNRSGKTGSVELYYNGDLFQFEEPHSLMEMAESAMNVPSEPAAVQQYNPFDDFAQYANQDDW